MQNNMYFISSLLLIISAAGMTYFCRPRGRNRFNFSISGSITL